MENTKGANACVQTGERDLSLSGSATISQDVTRRVERSRIAKSLSLSMKQLRYTFP